MDGQYFGQECRAVHVPGISGGLFFAGAFPPGKFDQQMVDVKHVPVKIQIYRVAKIRKHCIPRSRNIKHYIIYVYREIL